MIAGAEIDVDGELGTEGATVGFRPEALSVGDGPIKARIRAVEDLGSEVLVHVLVDHQGEERRLVAMVPAPFAGAVDDNVSLSLNGSVHSFGADGARLATVTAFSRAATAVNIEMAGGSV